MLVFLVIGAVLLLAVSGVAVWQIGREDREERIAMGAQVDELVQREDLHVVSSQRGDGVTTVVLRARAEDQASG